MTGGLADGISKKRVNPLFVALAVVLVAVVAAVGVVFFQLHSKISALQTGASFTFRYEIAPNSPDKPPLLNILERVNASSGSVSGQYAPGKLQLSFYQLNEDDSVKTSPFTRVYIDSEETLFDIGQLYTVLRQAVTDKLSLASVLLPEWSLGDYISQTQAAAVLGVETNKVELQELSGFTLSLKGLKKSLLPPRETATATISSPPQPTARPSCSAFRRTLSSRRPRPSMCC